MCNMTATKIDSRGITVDKINPFGYCGLTAEECMARKEEEQKTNEKIEEYTKKLQDLSYMEWTKLRGEMDRLFDKEIEEVKRSTPLAVLRSMTEL